MDDVVKLKAEIYDHMVAVQWHQAQMQEKNQRIEAILASKAQKDQKPKKGQAESPAVE
jgi:hypothetical protein